MTTDPGPAPELGKVTTPSKGYVLVPDESDAARELLDADAERAGRPWKRLHPGGKDWDSPPAVAS